MTWPTFKMYDSLKCKELVRRAKRIAQTQGTIPATSWAGENDRTWDVDGVYIFYIPDHVMKIFATPPGGQRELIYQQETKPKGPPGVPYATDRWRLIDHAVEILRRHMVLDDLADA